MKAILKKELKQMFVSPVFYIVLAFFIGLLNYLFLKAFFVNRVLTMRYFFELAIRFMLITIPAISMRIFSEDFRSGTIEFLLTKPISKLSIVTGKFFSLIIYYSLFIIAGIILFISIKGFGDIDSGLVITQFVGLIMLCISMFSISFMASSLSDNQVFAFLTGVGLNFLLILIGMSIVQMSLPYGIANILNELSFVFHYNNFLRGVINLSDIIYFLSIMFLSIYFSYLSLNKFKKHGKTGIGFFNSIEIVFLIGILLLVNLIIGRFNIFADFTENKIYTLSSASKDILGNVDDILNIDIYASSQLPPSETVKLQQIKDLLEQFKFYSHDNIKINYIDPIQEKTEEKAMSEGIYPIQIQVLENDEYAVKKGYFGMVFKYLDKKEIISYLGQNENYEYMLISKILRLTNENNKKIFLLTSNDIDRKSLTNLNQVLSKDYDVNIQQNGSGDSNLYYKDDDIWLLIKGEEDFDKSVYDAIKQNLSGDKTMLFMWQPYWIDVDKGLVAQKLDSQMGSLIQDEFGIEVGNGIVGDLKSNTYINFSQGYTSFSVPYPYFVKAFVPENLPIAQGITNVQMPFSTFLSGGSDKYEVQDILTTSPGGYVNKNLMGLSPDSQVSVNQSNLKSFSLGKYLKKDSTTIALIPNTLMFKYVLGQDSLQNLNYIKNIVDWLGGDKRLIDLRSKKINYEVFRADKSQKDIVRIINIFAVPIILVIVGVGIYVFVNIRRKSS